MANNNDGPRGYHDNPLMRKKTPPMDVWVNLAAAYPLPRSAKPFIPQCLDLTDTVAAPTGTGSAG
ncbi:MAG TPA: hypothetical protein VGJ45_01020 [Pseudonocardiaceae bacterium]|jgi:hypothetical protein